MLFTRIWEQNPVMETVLGILAILRPPDRTLFNPLEEYYAVARCCSRPPRRTLITLETPCSCMVTP